MIERAWNDRPEFLRMCADDEASDFETVHATSITILSRVDVHELRAATVCDDDELPMFLRLQAG